MPTFIFYGKAINKKEKGLGAPSLFLYRCKTNLEVKTKDL
jgi:hypothetical protein